MNTQDEADISAAIVLGDLLIIALHNKRFVMAFSLKEESKYEEIPHL